MGRPLGRRSARGLALWALRVAVFAALFVGAGYAGRATIIDGNALSLVWPAAGVAVLWLCSSADRTHLVIDSVVLGACTFVVNLSTGAPAPLALVFVVSNLLQVHLVLQIMRRTSGHLWGFGGHEPLGRLRDLAELIVAATVSCFVAGLVGTLAMRALIGVGDTSTFLVWWGRNTTGLLLIATIGLLLLAPALTDQSAERFCPLRMLRAIAGAVMPTSRRHAAEALVIGVGTVVLLWFVFVPDTDQALAFMMLFATVMAGVRLGPVGASLHGLVTGSVAIYFTINGHGPFAEVGDIAQRALFAQVFITMTVVTGLLLAFSRSERDRAMAQLNLAMGRLQDSERVAADRAALLSSVLDHTREGVAVVQADGAVLMRNHAGRRMLGLEGEGGATLESAEDYGLFHPDGRRVTEEEMPYTRAFAGETIESQDFHVRTADAPDGRVLEMFAAPMPGVTDDAPGRAVVQFRDVTAARQERDSLASFAGVVAHDLINPLAGVRGWAQALREAFEDGEVEPTEGMAMVERIQSSGEMMSQFIDDLLSYTVSRDTQLTVSRVDLSETARDVARMRTSSDSLPLITVEDAMSVEADPVLVRQLLDNLIGNAIKYVAPGVRPRVHVSSTERDGWLEVSVVDNGIGVPDDMRHRIFENFQRAHAEDYRGTGIGLAICRRVVQRHGGMLGVEPAGDGTTGSRFVFTLPLAPAAPVEAAARIGHGQTVVPV